MPSLADFSDITLRDEPLAPRTWLRVGGPAQYLVTPRSVAELQKVVQAARQEGLPLHVLGGGSNLLVRDEGIAGVVLSLAGGEFEEITAEGTAVTSGAAALLSNLISVSVKAGLAGLETLVGIPGTVGGALYGNAGGRAGDIGQYVHSVRVLTMTGEIETRTEDELSFQYRSSNLDGLAIVSAVFHLEPEDPEELTRRMRKLWITKKATQPFSFQSAGCIFKNPRGMSAGYLIEQAGLKGTKVGAAEVSDRHANFIVTNPGATAADVLRLIDLIKSRVSEQFGVDLELEVKIW